MPCICQKWSATNFKGKARARYEFGVKVTVAPTLIEGLVMEVCSMPSNPWAGHTLEETVK